MDYNQICDLNTPTTGCGGCDFAPTRVLVLGAAGIECAETFDNTRAAMRALGLRHEPESVGDTDRIAAFGAAVPALVLDGKVLSAGKPLSIGDVRALLEQAGVRAHQP